MLLGIQILGFARRPTCVVALVLAAALGSAGCGQKGPLYLPAPADPAPSQIPNPR